MNILVIRKMYSTQSNNKCQVNNMTYSLLLLNHFYSQQRTPALNTQMKVFSCHHQMIASLIVPSITDGVVPWECDFAISLW